MFGHSYQGKIVEKTAEIVVNGTVVGQVRVDTACQVIDNAVTDVVIARRGNVAAIPALHNFYEQNNAVFPENLGDTHGLVNGLKFDGKPFVYRSYDRLTGNLIFRPLPVPETTTDTVETTSHRPEDHDVDLQRLEGEGGRAAVTKPQTAETFPIGGDTPEVTVKTSGGTPESVLLADERKAIEAAAIADEHPLTPTDIGPATGGNPDAGAAILDTTNTLTEAAIVGSLGA